MTGAPTGPRDPPSGRTTFRRCRRRSGATTAPRICSRMPASAARPRRSKTLAASGLERAVESLVHYERIPNPKMRPFVESGLWDPTLDGFPDSRPDATDRAEQNGVSMGVAVKPAGNRPMQPVSDRFFYWLRATMLETRRLGYWWANRMLQTTHPLEEKMALLWHGHFATHENKVRDYRKMRQQIELFERYATGNLRELTIEVAQTPRCSTSSTRNTTSRARPNENFAREVMELFTMGVGNYTEKDVRECARAFTGWYFDDLAFKVDPAKHDAGTKEFLGRTGNFDGVDALEIVFEQPVTAEFLAAKIYRFLVRDELSPALREQLGAVLRDADYEVKPLLTAIFTSKDFYSAASYGGHIKGPVEHVVAMMKHLGAESIPGVPDFNQSTISHGPASVESAVGRGLGRRQGLDHAGAAHRPRQRGARRADSRHDGLSGLELQRRLRRRARSAPARRLRHRRGDGRQRSGDDERVRPRGTRARREVQHAHLGLHRLGAGGAQAHPDAAGRGAVRPDRRSCSRAAPRRRPMPSTI